METKKIAFVTLFTTIYALGVIVFAPISFLVFQVRIADALIPLSIVFGTPAVIGVSLGNIVANIYGGLGIIDIVGGSLANFLAAYIGWKIASRNFAGSRFSAIVVQNLIITGIVGSYLAVLFDVPLEIGFLGIFLGSIISMNILGYLLVLAIEKLSIRTRL